MSAPLRTTVPEPSPSATAPPWGLRDALLGWGAAIVMGAVVGALIIGLAGYAGSKADSLPLWLIAITQVPLWTGLLGAPLLAARRARGTLASEFGLAIRPVDVPVGIVTGLVGQFLHDHGLRQLSALDFSPEMLEQAKKRNVYQRFYQCDLLRPLPISQNFDAITAVGIFTEGHIGPEVLPRLKGLLKPGGLLAFSLRDDLEPGYQEGLAIFQVVSREHFSDGLESRPWTAWVCRA